MCSLCESDKREIWGPDKRDLDLDIIEGGNWMNLEQCPECRTYWVNVAYEPYLAFSYFIKWKRSPKEWKVVHDIDSGQTMMMWHANEVKNFWMTLSSDELKSIEFHRKRSYGHYNPIDMDTEDLNIDEIIKTAENQS